MSAPAVLSVDLDAIAANYAILRQQARGTAVGAAVKADAYGLGMARVAPVLANAGCRDFFVATIEEAAALRPLVSGAIFVLGGPRAGDPAKLADALPVLNSLDDIRTWKGPCALHFDTGMNRLGLSADEAQAVIRDPSLIAHLDVRLAISHYACSEAADHPMNRAQAERFAQLRASLSFPRWSLANSSGIFHMPDNLHDLAWPGYALYGGNPTPETANPMRPAVRLEAKILQIRQVRTGGTIGYNGTYTFPADTRTATVALGYADGFARALAGASLYFQGQPCPIRGRISMDVCAVETGHLRHPPREGDLIEVLGPHQTIDMLANHGKTIGYEILTRLGGRCERRYIKAS